MTWSGNPWRRRPGLGVLGRLKQTSGVSGLALVSFGIRPDADAGEDQ